MNERRTQGRAGQGKAGQVEEGAHTPLRVFFSSRPRDHAAHLANVQYYTSKGIRGNLRGRVLTG